MDSVTRADIHGRPIVERRAVSFSALNNFTNCARKFHAYDVAKIVKEPESEAQREGYRVHEAMAEFIATGRRLPKEYERYADWVATMLSNHPAEKVLVEQKWACTFELEPCEYFDRKKKPWLRTVADLLVLNPETGTALSVDWKTGKEPDPRYELLPAGFQLRLVAMMVFLRYPSISLVESKFIYLNEGVSTRYDMHRSDLKLFIPMVYEHAGLIQRAVRENHWPPRPSGLCKRHCGVTACEYWGKGSRG